jgi:curved DNA-binding protein CbpA
LRDSLYGILGLNTDGSATAAEIRAAYKKRAKETHPDVVDDGDETFKRVARAYSVLKDKEKRKEYDETGREDFDAKSYMEKHVELVLNLFAQAVDAQSQSNVLDESSNPFLIVRNELEHMIDEGSAALTEGSKRVARLKSLQTKVTKRRKKLSPFRKIIDASVEQIERRIVEITADLQTGRKALKHLNSAKWEDLFAVERDIVDTQQLTGRGFVLNEHTATARG